ncbi:MAG TPA: hypothetical protein VGF01_08010, partial [Terracidiphilus sp.]
VFVSAFNGKDIKLPILGDLAGKPSSKQRSLTVPSNEQLLHGCSHNRRSGREVPLHEVAICAPP